MIIYGESGVGKSSLIEAGLIPDLKEQVIDACKVLTVVQRIYINWIEVLDNL